MHYVEGESDDTTNEISLSNATDPTTTHPAAIETMSGLRSPYSSSSDLKLSAHLPGFQRKSTPSGRKSESISDGDISWSQSKRVEMVVL
ncbi:MULTISPECIES: hypothetical protein [unclassified Streptomyces]|uniref:hypothetical protein n=1 Tax=unclassified Streptomyces TaxID=2593676 RepID=UPI00056C3675|nr:MULTISPECIES: hypothetical protein [unclassified Streptomyces]MYY01013.1 hypothetical protein [Streptomyces sp. SID4913]